jgi:hypothetical protein
VHKRRIVAVATAATALLTPALSAPQAEAASAKFVLANENSWQCIRVKNHSKANNAPVVQYSCTGNPPKPTKSTYWRQSGSHIVNAYTGKCLAIKGGKKKSGAPLIQRTCSSKASDQKWSFSASSGWITIQSQGSKLFATVKGASVKVNAPIVLERQPYPVPKKQIFSKRPWN